MSVPVKIYRTVTYQEGQTPSNPNLSGDPVVNPINPNGGAAEELVPYDGAIKDVNLGEKGLSTGFVQYDTTPTDTPTGAGTVVWNPDKYTLDLSMGLGDSVQQIGMEVYYTPVKNQTGSLIPDGTFVMATGSLGNSERMTIAPAVTDGSVDSKYMLGVTTHDIANGGDGLVTWFGEIRGFNTNTKAPVGETWIDGTVLWNNPAVAGGFTSVEPQAPNLKIPVAIVISAGNNGVIFVRPRLGMRLTDLHDVDAFTPSDKDLISYDSALGHWDAKSLGSVIGGTSSQFLKGDGSLDSNSYALASQINIASGQVAFGTGSGTIGGDSGLTWDNVNKILTIDTISIRLGGNRVSSNIAFGSGTLSSNTTGIQNIAIGQFSLALNTTGSANSAIGFNVLSKNVSTNNNTAIGFSALRENTGLNNTGIGSAVMLNQTTGSNNVALGQNSGRYISSGTNLTITNNSVFLGFDTRANANNQTNQIVIGYQAIGQGSNTTTIGNSSTVLTRLYGELRVNTINNLGTAATEVIVTDATGVLSKRTVSELLTDGNAITGTIASGQVAFGTGVNTVGGSNNLFWDSVNNRLGVNTNTPASRLEISSTNESLRISGKSSANIVNDLYIVRSSSGTGIFSGPNIRLDDSTLNNNIAIQNSQGQFGIWNFSTGSWVQRIVLTNTNLFGVLTTAPTNTLDVNGTARIRTLTGTTGYLPLLSSTGVMGQSVVYNTSAGSVLIGTINEVSGHKVRISGGALNITNWQSSAGAYDKLSIDFGEFRGIGYDADYNEVFFAGTVTVPVKIDTDAPTDSLNVLSTGGVQMKNLQAGTISDNIGLNSSGELVKGVAGLVQSVSGTAVNNTDPLNPIISVDNWTSETLIDTITLNDTNGNVTYTCNSTITIFTNSKLNIKTLYLNITNIASSGIPLGGAFEIKGYNFYNFIGANDISVLYEVKEFRGTSYTESLLPLLRPDALGTIDGQLIFRKINNTQQQPPFTSTNGEITIKIAKFKQS